MLIIKEESKRSYLYINISNKSSKNISFIIKTSSLIYNYYNLLKSLSRDFNLKEIIIISI